MLKDELSTSCHTISLSLDIWTSSNSLPVMGVIGHWLTADFHYREKVIEFKELTGVHSGENIASAVEGVLVELDLEQKLIAITADNASNNERMVDVLADTLSQKHGSRARFQGSQSYVRCLGHIINLIVKDILAKLNTGNPDVDEMCAIIDREHPQSLDVVGRVRYLAVWIQQSPQRKQAWIANCKRLGLSTKLIEYDVPTRWNSTFRMLFDAIKVSDYLQKSSGFAKLTPRRQGDSSRHSFDMIQKTSLVSLRKTGPHWNT